MLTYQVRKRIFRLATERKIAFPAAVTLTLVLKPLQPFGCGLDEGKTCVKDAAATARFNSNTGHHHIIPDKPLAPLDITTDYENRRLRLRGNILSIESTVNSPEELDDFVQSSYFLVPMLLNIEFVDPPYIEQVYGKLGDVDFRWEVADWKMLFEVTSQELQAQKVIISWHRQSVLAEAGGRRLLAALHYFHVACRLGVAGASPWEFMAEMLLNYSKILEVLFPSEGEAKSMVTARRELEKLGFSKQVIESDFIPALALRNKIDVAHVDLCNFSREQLEVLHRYTECAEIAFRGLLRRVFSGLEDQSYCIPEHSHVTPRSDAIKTIEMIAKNLRTDNA